jgi:tellurite resistance protein
MIDETTPASLVNNSTVLRESVGPLSQLAQINPSLLDHVIKLAMVMGMYEAEVRLKEREKVVKMAEERFGLSPFSFVNRRG